ncbi:arylesterase [Ferrimonas balearica]|uniref:arylesterase n=1 Tax=Ferrimonas balearica TaxID=44012 RepID=UPI001C9930FB|nr:arylesterase [Ferrimonas balearica]MBY5922170.1 arylesterase [Ferrimonas balearica]MBY5994490.1 arylesterase [Ferrimonas balearica]
MLRRSLLILIICLYQPGAWADQRSILILGDSLSASYGMDETEGWVRKLQQNLPDARLINASVSGETSDGGLRRLPGLLEQHQPDWVFVELGGNDGLRGFQPTLTQQNLDEVIALSKASGAQVMLSEVMVPPNYGRRYAERFQQIFVALAEAHQIELVPFFMTEIAVDPNLMQADGIHPNRAAQDRIAAFLQPWFEQAIAE